MNFKGKVVLVTGASSGIGAATAVAFAGEGAKVVMVGRNQNKLKNVEAKCVQKGNKPLVIIADVSKSEDNERIIAETINDFGQLDVLVNNAGMSRMATIFSPDTMEVYEDVMRSNLQSVVHLTHLGAPHLAKTKGNIINISSVGSMMIPFPGSFAYAVSKAGMDHFTRAMALELAPVGVRVNVINPGAVRTDIIESQGIQADKKDAAWDDFGKLTPLKKVGEPEEIADLIMFLASDKARSITGSSYVSDNGFLLSGVPDEGWGLVNK